MKYIFTLILCVPFLVFSQKLDLDKLQNLEPRNIGPAGMAGRVTTIDVVTGDPSIMYVGTASGGLWKSTSGGIKWEPIFDDQTTGSIGAVAIQQDNPSVIWVGTGEGNPRNSLNGGDGLYRSLDGGKSWKKMGLEKTRHIHRIIIHPKNPNVIYVGAIGSPWGAHPERGVFKTSDGGKTWTKILYTNESSGTADLVIDPTNPNKLLAAMWEHDRDPWFFNSGGPGSGLYMTHDGGESWQKLSEEDGLPGGELGRIGLAIAPSQPERIYALIESSKNALYRSDDGGFSWQKINDKNEIGNRPFYYSDIYVDPKNENRVYSIFTYVNVSEDGGKSFSSLMPAYGVSNGIHPDHHAWWIHPENPDFMMDGNDGGLNITRDRGKSWRFIQTLPVAQFYHIAVDNELPYNVYGGMQDNGSWAGPAYVWKSQGIRNSYWQEISFGDGFDVLPDPTNSRYGISTAQQGSASIYDRVSGYNESIRPTNPGSDTELRFNWNAAMNRSPFDPETIYFGSQFVHKSTDGGQTWEIISPDLTTNDPEKQKQDESGGLTMDATGAENFCTILVIEPSPKEKDVIWVGTDDGNLQITRDGGQNWENLVDNIKDFPEGAWITQIKPSNKNSGEALVVANDYRRYNYTPYAWRTRNYGQSWERIVDENDVISYTLCIVEDPEESNLMFLGTDDGLYVSVDGAENWTKWKNGFPTTNVMDLVIHPREHDLIIGTFGRAAWVLDDIRPLRSIAREGVSIINNRLKIFPPPTAYLVANQQPSGTRFGADALYNGQNRTDNARIRYLINQPEVDKADEKAEKTVSYDSLTFEVLNTQNEVIRTIQYKAPEEAGIHEFNWSLDEKGVNYPTRSRRESNNEPGGVSVLPGTYKIKITYGEEKDSTVIEVKADPRLELTKSEMQARYDALKDLQSKAAVAYEAVEQLKESIDMASDYQKELKEEDAEGLKEEIELAANVVDTLNFFIDRFVGAEDDRQGITRSEPDYINYYYFSAYRYTSNALHAPTATENDLIARFDVELRKVIDDVNEWYEENWTAFRSRMEDVELSPFKEYKMIDY